MRDDVIAGWLVGVFHHDPSDDSHFWVEQRVETGEERLACTGAHREALYINGKYILPTEVLHLDPDPDRARDQYLEIAKYILKLIHRRHNDQTDK